LNVSDLFRDGIEPVDKLYRIVRDEPRSARLRAFAERLWGFFEPFADEDFTLAIAKNFHARFWEMYLAFGLNAQGHRLLPARKSGPDLLIEGPEKPVWLEAVAATKGSGADRVPELELNVVQSVPDELIILRLRQSIDQKFRKLRRYLEKGIVSATDPFIIAVNGRAVPFAFLEAEMPRILKALFPLGYIKVTLNRETLEAVDERHEYRPQIAKLSGEGVSTTVFLNPEYAAISAVLFCNSDLGNHPPDERNIGDDFTLIHNPNALNPIPRRWLKCGVECWVDGDNLVINDWWKGRLQDAEGAA
jgi:type I restriction enzyme S subunit